MFNSTKLSTKEQNGCDRKQNGYDKKQNGVENFEQKRKAKWVKKKKLWSWPNYDQEFYGSINSEGGSMWKFWGHASSAPPMVVNAVQWGSPFTFYSKSDTFYSCVFIVISHSHFLAGTWFETGGGLRLVVCLTVTSSELWWSVSTPEGDEDGTGLGRGVHEGCKRYDSVWTQLHDWA